MRKSELIKGDAQRSYDEFEKAIKEVLIRV